MFRVLIVDDEPRICSMVTRLIEWEELGLESVGTANNGLDAVRLINEEKPDIVIMDMQIPGLTGLEVIEKYYDKDDAPNFIVISGYREFDYAQKALRFGVEDYLLKPLKKTDLNHALNRIVKLRTNRENDTEQHQNLVDAYNLQKTIIHKNELLKFIEDPNYNLKEEKFNFREGEFFFLILNISFENPDHISTDLSTRILTIAANKLMRSLEADSYLGVFSIKNLFSYFLVNYSPIDHIPFKEKCDYMQNIINEINIDYYPTVLSSAICDPVSSTSDLKYALKQAKKLINLRIVLGGKRLITPNRLQSLSKGNLCLLNVQERQKIMNYFEALNSDEAIDFLKPIFEEIHNSQSMCVGNLYFEIMNFILEMQRILKDADTDFSKTIESFEAENEQLLLEIENCNSIDCLEHLLYNEIRKEIGACTQLKEEIDIQPVRMVKQYVKDNIDKQIFLEDMAPMLFVSTEYLGILFKQKTGITFSNYVIQTRMETAKKLLESSSFSIGEIATKVGYSDSRHFSKVFRKTYGINPTAYRKYFC